MRKDLGLFEYLNQTLKSYFSIRILHSMICNFTEIFICVSTIQYLQLIANCIFELTFN
jgi:hypothetical protein